MRPCAPRIPELSVDDSPREVVHVARDGGVARAEELSEDRSRLRSHWIVETYFNHINDTKLATGEIRQRTHATACDPAA